MKSCSCLEHYITFIFNVLFLEFLYLFKVYCLLSITVPQRFLRP